MKTINVDSIVSPWPGYPQAVTAGGFCFLSGNMALNQVGDLISGWEDLPQKGASMASKFSNVDALEGPVGAQTWLAYHQMESLLASIGGTINDLLRIHIYQKDKRFFPVCERVRISYEPKTPVPSSGLGVSGGSPDGNAWIVIDGISIDPKEWKFKGRRNVLRLPGALVSASHYSQGIEAGPYIFLAGQIPIDTSKPGKPLIRTYEDIPEEGRFLQAGRSHTDTRNGPIAAQTWFTYDHIRRILSGTNSSMDEIVKVTVFLQDMRDFHTFHEVHKHFFPNSLPALTVTEFREVGHRGTLLEIEVTAMRQTGGLERREIQEAGSIKSGSHSALAVVAGGLVYVSGQSGVDSSGRAIKELTALPQPLRPNAASLVRATSRQEATLQAITIFENLKTILKEAGTTLSSLTRIIVYLEDFHDFTAFDLVCKHYLPGPRPALACITNPRVHPVPGTRICVEAIAVKE